MEKQTGGERQTDRCLKRMMEGERDKQVRETDRSFETWTGGETDLRVVGETDR